MKSSIRFTSALIIIILSQISTIEALLNAGINVILDLDATNNFDFSNQASQWNFKWGVSSIYTFCGLLKGYDSAGAPAFFERDFPAVSAHQSVHITLTFWLIDDWQKTNGITIYVKDGLGGTSCQKSAIITQYDQTQWTGNICGDASKYELEPVQMYISTVHVASIVRLGFFQDNTDTGQFGLRDIQIIFSTKTVPAEVFCSITHPVNLSQPACACPLGQYNDSTTCKKCNRACASCFGPDNTDYIECATDSTYDGSTGTCIAPPAPCGGSTNYYYYLNNSCLSACDSPLVSTDQGSYYQCDAPCQTSKEYYYLNGTCSLTCPPPYVAAYQNLYRVCSFPCNMNNFLYDNGSCFSTCNSLFKQYNLSGYLYCKYPCTSNEYLLWDGSCSLTCPQQFLPLSISGHLFCSTTCLTSQYLNWDSSCVDTCPSPYNISTLNGNKFCQLPCLPDQYFYYNGSCVAICLLPLVITYSAGISYCNKPCPSSADIYYYPSKKTCKSICPQPYTISYAEYGPTCYLDLSPSDLAEIQSMGTLSKSAQTGSNIGLALLMIMSPFDPAAMTNSLVSQILVYTKYLDISHSARLEAMYQNGYTPIGIMSLANFDTPPSLKQKLSYSSNIDAFIRYDIGSSFLMNAWDMLMWLSWTLVYFSAALWLVWLTLEMRKGCNVLSGFGSMKISAQNFFVGRLYDSYADVTLFIGLELHSVRFESFWHGLSFGLAVLFLVMIVFMLGIHLGVSLKYQRLRRQEASPHQLELLESKTQGVRVLLDDFKEASFIQQAFFLFLAIRNVTFGVVLTSLVKYPLAQICIITLLNLAILLILLIKRPFKSRINFAQQITLEVILLIANVSLGTIAVFDRLGKNPSHIKEKLCEVILKDNLVAGFMPMVFMVPKVFCGLKDLATGVKTFWIKAKTQGFNLGLDLTWFDQEEARHINEPSRIEGRAHTTSSNARRGRRVAPITGTSFTNEGISRAAEGASLPETLQVNRRSEVLRDDRPGMKSISYEDPLDQNVMNMETLSVMNLDNPKREKKVSFNIIDRSAEISHANISLNASSLKLFSPYTQTNHDLISSFDIAESPQKSSQTLDREIDTLHKEQTNSGRLESPFNKRKQKISAMNNIQPVDNDIVTIGSKGNEWSFNLHISRKAPFKR